MILSWILGYALKEACPIKGAWGIMNHHCIKMKFSFKGFFRKCDQIQSFPRIWSHLLKKSLMEIFLFCACNGFIKKKKISSFSSFMTLS